LSDFLENPEEEYLREQLIKKLKGRVPKNIEGLVRLLSIMHANPGTPTNDIIVLLQGDMSETAIFRNLKFLRSNGCTLPNNRVNFPVNNRTFILPNSVRKGQLPIADLAPYTHLASYLTKFNDNDIIPPYGKNKAEICKLVRAKIEKTPLLANQLVVNILEGLAAFAIIQENMSAFENMIGKLEPPKEI